MYELLPTFMQAPRSIPTRDIQVVYGLDFDSNDRGRQLAAVREAIQAHMSSVRDAVVVSKGPQGTRARTSELRV